MNVVLIKECLHMFSQTENAFSVDVHEWACESNTIQQNIHVPGTKCLHAGRYQLDHCRQTIVMQ